MKCNGLSKIICAASLTLTVGTVVADSEISQGEVDQLFKQRSKIKQSEKGISNLFRNYHWRMFKFERTGKLGVGVDSTNADDIDVEINFYASVDQAEFARFKRELGRCLNQVALAKGSITIPDTPDEGTSNGRHRNRGRRRSSGGQPEWDRSEGSDQTLFDLGKRLWRTAGLPDADFRRGHGIGDDVPKVAFIAFETSSGNEAEYHLYLVPREIKEAISSQLHWSRHGENPSYVVCALLSAEDDKPIYGFYRVGTLCNYDYWYYVNYGRRQRIMHSEWGVWPLVFSNRMAISAQGERIFNSGRRARRTGRKKSSDFNVTTEPGNKLKINLSIPIPADYAKRLSHIYLYSLDGDNGDMAERANKGLIYKLEVAAKRGDSRAQYCLGKAYDNGIGVERDLTKSGIVLKHKLR